jgi:hypothetical protein
MEMNQYIQLATCISYKNTDGEIINAEHDAIGNKAIAFVGTSGIQLGWHRRQTCSQRTGRLSIKISF